MKKNIKPLNIEAKFYNSKEGNLLVRVDVIKFIEDNICYVICPALDIVGYGHTEADASKSFEITLFEYIKYTMHKKTLKKDLIALGWKIKDKNTFEMPSLSTLAERDESLRNLLDNKIFQKDYRNISLPAFA
jgi:hypothetical protein